MDMCQYTSVQTHRMYNPRVDPPVNYRLCVIITCQCRIVTYYTCPTLVGDANNGGGCACVGVMGVYGKSLDLPLVIAVNLKLL